MLVSIDNKGIVYTWDAKNFNLKKKLEKVSQISSSITKTQVEIVTAFLSESQKSIFVLRNDGKLILMSINDGHINSQKDLNDDLISSFSYNE